MAEQKDNLIISYITLRRLIGIMGILLPFICIIGAMAVCGYPVQDSISYYYYTNMRDFFIGLMACISMFLITYNGYTRTDSLVTTSSGIAGLCVAVFPCMCRSGAPMLIGIFQLDPVVSEIIHVSSAGVFFVLLAVNSIFLFTKSSHSPEEFSLNKKIRNAIYVSCGVIILVSLVTLLVLSLAMGRPWAEEHRITIIIETVMLLAFGTSWLIKGETLFRDREN